METVHVDKCNIFNLSGKFGFLLAFHRVLFLSMQCAVMSNRSYLIFCNWCNCNCINVFVAVAFSTANSQAVIQDFQLNCIKPLKYIYGANLKHY